MAKSPEQERPNGAVAAQIVARLIDEGFLPPTFAKRVAAGLDTGAITASDWRRLVEQMLAWEMQESDHG